MLTNMFVLFSVLYVSFIKLWDDKLGLYFSDSAKLCPGMGIEYAKDMIMCRQEVTQPIVLYEGEVRFPGLAS